MLRIAFVVLLFAVCPLFAADPVDLPSLVHQAKSYLAAKQPARAILVLEAALPQANGDADFLHTLAAAYNAEIKELEASAAPDAVVAGLRKKRDLLPKRDSQNKEAQAKLAEGVKSFNLAAIKPEKYAEAAEFFAAAFRKVEMTPEQTAAWCYCRIRVANDRLTKDPNPQTASEVLREIEETLALVPNHTKLREAGNKVITAAKARGGKTLPRTNTGVESANFSLQVANQTSDAQAVLAEAESLRQELYRRWNANAPAWSPKCELILTTNEEPAQGQALVELSEGKATKRTLTMNLTNGKLPKDTFNRELTHLLLADLFPYKAPPRWVEVGMAANNMTETEQSRYRTLLQKLAEEQRLLPLAEILAAKDVPSQNIVEYHVQASSLVQFLLLWRGEAHFLSFLRDQERYGSVPALQQGYGTTDIAQLESLWKRAAMAK